MIRQLTPDDAEAFAAIRNEALLAAPLAFGSSPEDDFAANIEELRDHMNRAPASVFFGACADGQLVGTAGFLRARHRKASHKAHLWGMYVTPEQRRRGLAAALVQAVIDHARTVEGIEWVQLEVSSSADPARRLYESVGFLRWGTEPAALKHAGEVADNHHMALAL